jgi:Transcriptional regulator, AbiEi antitoxin, Type IV TA system
VKQIKAVNEMAEANLTRDAESMFSEFLQSLGGTVRRLYYGVQSVGDFSIVSNVQLYLDLINFKGRGEEQAAAIREQLLWY